MTIGKKLLLGFGLALAFIVALGWIAYRNTGELIARNDWAAHSLRGLGKLIELA